MNLEEKYFDYTVEPGKFLKENLSIPDGKPLISVITAYYNCKEYIMQTANSVLNQTFPHWEWVIVNDGSTEEGTEELLKELTKKDKRIKVYHQKNQGRLVARDEAIARTSADIIYMLDSDDVLDPTLLECGYWTLRTNPTASWAYCNCVNFDKMEFLYRPEFNSEQEKKENLVIGSSFIVKKDLLEVGGYNVVDQDVHEDWHLWLRMLEKGKFPVKMNMYGFWYRQRSGSIRHTINGNKSKDKHANKVIKQQAKKIKHFIDPIEYPVSSQDGYYSYPTNFDWDRKPINIKGEKINLLLIVPWFAIGGADKFNYDLIARLDKNIYNITIISTEPCEYIWRQKFEKYATIFDLTTFLHRKNWAAFIHYIIKTRNIDIVMQTNSYYGYYVLPWLKSEFPEVVFTDYVHAHDWSWRNGGYARESVAVSNFVDRTFTCNQYVQKIMTNDMGRKQEKLKTVYIGVTPEEFDETKIAIEDIQVKNKLEGKKIILFICRIVEIKRPIFILKVLENILKQNKDFVLLVVGDGEQMAEMKKTANVLNLNDFIIFTGMKDNNQTKQYYKMADVTVICSFSEGIALTAYESLAMGVPVVSSDVGGQKELIDNTVGRIIPLMQNQETDIFKRNYKQEEIEEYTKAILEITLSKDYKKIKERCREKIVNNFSIDNMADTMDKEFQELVKQGTKIGHDQIQNKELYKQYLVLYNVIDQRNYNIPIGGITERNTNYRTANLKSRLWKNPFYRVIVKILKGLGLWEPLKKSKIAKKIKKIIRKVI